MTKRYQHVDSELVAAIADQVVAHIWGDPDAEPGEIEELSDEQVAALRRFAQARPDLWTAYFGDLDGDDDGQSDTVPVGRLNGVN
ncbi:hypothetical protein EV193_101871 [Herbihabitans rhizosphaerae]|uniref:Uncharacterized protein n=1 Tax=Herbihabitans rhizosphaerae TaxID=1872711 RepID=A0A4Q7L5R2_9PSEU|nr:hypothetical protein [Herbihabitans rhizosphaerae]RZS44988.1 hypothetical protein EV193_101871 [Herbihabitans rhizosphaerae]